MDCPRVRYPQLNDVVEADLAEQGYQVLTDAGQQVDKVIQLYEVSAQVLQNQVVPNMTHHLTLRTCSIECCRGMSVSLAPELCRLGSARQPLML